MKTTLKLFGVIALVAAIGLTMVACSDDDGDDGITGDPALSGTITINLSAASVGTELTAAYSGSEPVSFQWKNGGSNVGTASTTNPNKYTPAAAGSYTVTVSAEGYSSKTSAAVTVAENSVNLAQGSWGTAGNATITGLPAGRYIVIVGDIDDIGYVKHDGSFAIATSFYDAYYWANNTDAEGGANFAGGAITERTNDETYNVFWHPENWAVDKTTPTDYANSIKNVFVCLDNTGSGSLTIGPGAGNGNTTILIRGYGLGSFTASFEGIPSNKTITTGDASTLVLSETANAGGVDLWYYIGQDFIVFDKVSAGFKIKVTFNTGS
jgi:hypothetical protein